jgi:hypothetical protein
VVPVITLDLFSRSLANPNEFPKCRLGSAVAALGSQMFLYGGLEWSAFGSDYMNDLWFASLLRHLRGIPLVLNFG